MQRGSIVVLCAVLSASCFKEPEVPEGLSCSSEENCPPGQECFAGLCLREDPGFVPDGGDGGIGQTVSFNDGVITSIPKTDCDGFPTPCAGLTQLSLVRLEENNDLFLVISAGVRGVLIYRHLGGGDFQFLQTLELVAGLPGLQSYVTYHVIGELDSNPGLDIAFIYHDGPTSSDMLGVALNDPNGENFFPASSYQTELEGPLHLADIDTDGYLEIIDTERSGGFRIQEEQTAAAGQGIYDNGFFFPIPNLMEPPKAYPGSEHWIDINDDGRVDIASCQPALRVALHTPNPGIAYDNAFEVRSQLCSSMALASFDSDTLPDIALERNGNELITLLQDQSNPGFFLEPVVSPLPQTGDDYTSSVPVNLNDDGLTDLVALAGATAVNDPNVDGLFAPGPVLPEPNRFAPVSIAVADLNGDGKDDIVRLHDKDDELTNDGFFEVIISQ